MNGSHFERACEIAEAMAQEETVHLFLERLGVDPYQFIEVVARARGPAAVERYRQDGQDGLGRLLAAEFLRGTVVGVLAARDEAAQQEEEL